MSDPVDPLDPRGLIREAYRIEGIGLGDCRSIFLDWALGKKDGGDREAAAALLARYAPAHPDHPMTGVLREAADAPPPRRGRAGGAMGRRRPQE